MKADKEIHAEDASAELGNEAGAKAMDAALRSSFVILKGVIGVLVVYSCSQMLLWLRKIPKAQLCCVLGR